MNKRRLESVAAHPASRRRDVDRRLRGLYQLSDDEATRRIISGFVRENEPAVERGGGRRRIRSDSLLLATAHHVASVMDIDTSVPKTMDVRLLLPVAMRRDPVNRALMNAPPDHIRRDWLVAPPSVWTALSTQFSVGRRTIVPPKYQRSPIAMLMDYPSASSDPWTVRYLLTYCHPRNIPIILGLARATIGDDPRVLIPALCRNPAAVCVLSEAFRARLGRSPGAVRYIIHNFRMEDSGPLRSATGTGALVTFLDSLTPHIGDPGARSRCYLSALQVAPLDMMLLYGPEANTR